MIRFVKVHNGKPETVGTIAIINGQIKVSGYGKEAFKLRPKNMPIDDFLNYLLDLFQGTYFFAEQV